MAHKSKQKHLKHMRARQRASATTGEATKGTGGEPAEHRGIVRSIAHAAAEKIVKKEKKIAKKVKSLLG